MEEYKESRNIFKFLAQVITTFGMTILIISVLTLLVGEEAKNISTIFQLGKQGIAQSTIWQFFLVAFINTSIGWIICNENILTKVPALAKQLLAIGSNGVIVILFVYLFEWFPIDMWQAWVGFIICFAGCTSTALIVSFLKLKIENQWFEENLRQYWEDQEETDEQN